jgi:hypothetical protein
MSPTLRFNPGGHVQCLYTEVIDLRGIPFSMAGEILSAHPDRNAH